MILYGHVQECMVLVMIANEELTRMHSRWNTAWCVFWDFNIIQYLNERFGCEAFNLAMFAFSDFIKAN